MFNDLLQDSRLNDEVAQAAMRSRLSVKSRHAKRPKHAYRFIANNMANPDTVTPQSITLSSSDRQIMALLADGAFLLFDMQHHRALLYRMRGGMQQLAELTVRSIAKLVRLGLITLLHQSGHLLHFAKDASAADWFRNKDDTLVMPV